MLWPFTKAEAGEHNCATKRPISSSHSPTRRSGICAKKAFASSGLFWIHRSRPGEPCLDAYGVEEHIRSLVKRCCTGTRAPDTLRVRVTQVTTMTVVVRHTPSG